MKKSSQNIDLINHLSNGDVCIFETDTVVGIACAIFLQNNHKKTNININKIFKIKNRDKNKKLPWLISNTKMLSKYIEQTNDYAKLLISKKWPGHTTLIFKANTNCPTNLCTYKNKQSSIAFRIPNSKILIEAIEEIGSPLVCTSANISGSKAPLSLNDVELKILQSVDFVYTQPQHIQDNKKASTIIDCTGSSSKIIRP